MKARILTSAALALVLLVSPALAANANDASTTGVTFYKDVLPIVQQHCQDWSGCVRLSASARC